MVVRGPFTFFVLVIGENDGVASVHARQFELGPRPSAIARDYLVTRVALRKDATVLGQAQKSVTFNMKRAGDQPDSNPL